MAAHPLNTGILPLSFSCNPGVKQRILLGNARGSILFYYRVRKVDSPNQPSSIYQPESGQYAPAVRTRRRGSR